MKVEQLHESLRPALTIVAGLTLAVIFGSQVGKGEPKLVFLFFAAVAAAVLLIAVRQRIWMIIPAVWVLGGKISVLPLPFTVTQLGILLAFGTYLVLKALKIVRFKPKFGTVEIWMVVVLVYLATVFIRNPVGMEALGSDRVGGRPYFDAIIAGLAYWVLARSVASPKDALIVPFLSIAGNGFHALINTIADRFPSTVGPISELYSGIYAAENPDAGPVALQEGGRLAYLSGVGSATVLAACSFWRPLTIINPLYFWRFVTFALGMWAVLLSGYRSSLFALFLIFLISSYFRRGMREVFSICWMGALFLCAVIFMQGTIIQLPFAAQRALSFLPGKWDYAAKAEAENSTEWRVMMWQAMLGGNKYIDNKWLGDGFGFTKQQLDIMTANSENGTNEQQQENLLISGGVHSGPVTTIRYVGYVGLALYLVFIILVAMKAARLIRRAEGTPFYTMALLLGIPYVMFPVTFVLIFGSYDNDLPYAIFGAGLLKLLENSLDVHAAEPVKDAPAKVIQPPRFRPAPQFAPAGRVS